MKKIYLLHPLLFAVYPIVFLYSHNVQEVLIEQTYIPIGLSLLGTVVLWGLLTLIIKDRLKASLITTVFLIFFFTYGYIFDGIEQLNIFNVKHRHLLPVALYLVGYISYFIYITNRQDLLQRLSKVLSIIAVVLVILNLVKVIPYEIKKLNLSKQFQTMQQSKQISSVTTNLPDIYYLIVDEFASLSTIKQVWGYDNSKFVNFLKDKGFFIAEESRTKYPQTDLAIPSYLNMSYINKNANTLERYYILNNNRVINILKQKGYKTVAFDNWYTINQAKGLINVDYNFNYLFDSKPAYIDGFSMLLVNTTMLKPFSYLFELEFNDLNNLHRNSTLYTFEKLTNLPYIKSPKFVYAHILCPHTPFTFGRNGEEVDPANRYNWKEKKYYLDQYIYISKELEKTVDTILKNSKQPPIIIIQSDHGPTPEIPNNPNEKFEIAEEETHKIFNAYYLPNGGNKRLYKDISPINTFRLIFNTYFNEKFVLLED